MFEPGAQTSGGGGARPARPPAGVQGDERAPHGTVGTASDERRLAPGTDVLRELDELATRMHALAARTVHHDEGAPSWSGATRARVLGLLDRFPGLVAALRSPVLVAQRSAAAAAGSEREFVDHWSRATGSTRWQAAQEVAAAQALERLPQVRDAVVAGAMRTGHLDVLARTLEGASPKVAATLTSSQTQAEVVELARGTDAREFARTVAALVAEVDADHLETEREASRRARFLSMTHTREGTFLKGRLDPLAGQVLARALEATGHREDADRTHLQARADALTALARHALTGGMPALPGRPPRSTALSPSAVEPGTPSGHALVAGAARRAAADVVGGTPAHVVGGGSAALCGGAAFVGAPVDDAAVDDAAVDDAADVRVDLPDGAPSAPVAQVSLLVPAETWHEVRRLQHHRRRGRTASTPSNRSVGGRAPAVPGLDEGGLTPQPEPPPDGVPPAPPDGVPPAPPGGAAPVPPAVTDGGTVLSHTELAVALCDCSMTRVVMNAQGLPLDVGRASRSFTPAQRVAVVARDRMCAWNGCSAVPAVCQVHHVAWWHRDGGRSDLSNAVLLCSFHHHEVHRLDLDIERLVPPPRTGPSARAHPAGAEQRTLSGVIVGSRAVSSEVVGSEVVGGRVVGSEVVGSSGVGSRVAEPMRYRFRDRHGRVLNAPAPTAPPRGAAP
ncbi:HNH endonuclease signature motif containing protein [Cellulomonas persica]|uniref:HNH nuclease domain-containing protein n=1 Tax=Cellulomonas persica TaxID=76861 RepID=A0A510UXN5_9CELL|nr:HNH endonuclease signature motif containing protein [Cellulomonas persica]GEK19329.1 hypothetical protein CPE01_30620 [Cellulomonas persica]